LQNYSRILGRPTDAFAVCHRQSERLLTKDMFSRLSCCQRDLLMQKGWCANQNRVNLRLSEQITVVLKDILDAKPARRPLGRSSDYICHGHQADFSDRTVRCSHNVRYAARSDNSDSYLFQHF
jgi:hypothetical protein